MPEENNNEEHEIVFDGKEHLRESYIGFLKNGGIFVSCKKIHAIAPGEKRSISMQMPGEFDTVVFEGEVAWVNPEGVDRYRPAGFGVHFPDDLTPSVRSTIENILGAALGSEKPTFTI